MRSDFLQLSLKAILENPNKFSDVQNGQIQKLENRVGDPPSEEGSPSLRGCMSQSPEGALSRISIA